MPTEKVNNQSRQVGVRLPHELDARIRDYALDNRLSHGQAMMALIRKGLGDCETLLDTRETPYLVPLSQLTERLEALEAVVSNMVSPGVSPEVVSGVGPTLSPSLDTAKHYLGPLCRNGHDWDGSGQSRRYRSTKTCTVCAAENQRKKDAKKARIASQ